jgi:hypothetical protein
VTVHDALDRCQPYSGSGKFAALVQPLKHPEELVGVAHVESGLSSLLTTTMASGAVSSKPLPFASTALRSSNALSGIGLRVDMLGKSRL